MESFLTSDEDAKNLKSSDFLLMPMLSRQLRTDKLSRGITGSPRRGRRMSAMCDNAPLRPFEYGSACRPRIALAPRGSGPRAPLIGEPSVTGEHLDA